MNIKVISQQISRKTRKSISFQVCLCCKAPTQASCKSYELDLHQRDGGDVLWLIARVGLQEPPASGMQQQRGAVIGEQKQHTSKKESDLLQEAQEKVWGEFVCTWERGGIKYLAWHPWIFINVGHLSIILGSIWLNAHMLAAWCSWSRSESPLTWAAHICGPIQLSCAASGSSKCSLHYRPKSQEACL